MKTTVFLFSVTSPNVPWFDITQVKFHSQSDTQLQSEYNSANEMTITLTLSSMFHHMNYKVKVIGDENKWSRRSELDL